MPVTKSLYKKVMFDPNKGVMMIAMFESTDLTGVSRLHTEYLQHGINISLLVSDIQISSLDRPWLGDWFPVFQLRS